MPEPSSSRFSADTLPPVATVAVAPEETSRHLRFHHTTFRHLWRTHFTVLEDGPLLPRPIDVSVQVVRDARYRHSCVHSQFENYRYFCYTLSGTGGFWDAAGTYSVPASKAFLVEKDDAEAGYFYPEDASEPWVFLAFNYNGLPAHAMTRALIQRYGSIYTLPPETPIVRRLLGYEGEGQRFANIPVTDASQLVVELLLALLAAGQTHEEADPVTELARRAIAIMSAQDDVSVQDVAHRIGVSREHLSRCFHKRFGMSPRKFCLEQRMRKACVLLKETDMPIKAIAEQLGYAEYSNFAHAFRQVTQMMPGEFRLHGILPLAIPFTNQP